MFLIYLFPKEMGIVFFFILKIFNVEIFENKQKWFENKVGFI